MTRLMYTEVHFIVVVRNIVVVIVWLMVWMGSVGLVEVKYSCVSCYVSLPKKSELETLCSTWWIEIAMVDARRAELCY